MPGPDNRFFHAPRLGISALNVKSAEIRHIAEDFGIDSGERSLELAHGSAAGDPAQFPCTSQRAQPSGNAFERGVIEQQQPRTVILRERMEAGRNFKLRKNKPPDAGRIQMEEVGSPF